MDPRVAERRPPGVWLSSPTSRRRHHRAARRSRYRVGHRVGARRARRQVYLPGRRAHEHEARRRGECPRHATAAERRGRVGPVRAVW